MKSSMSMSQQKTEINDGFTDISGAHGQKMEIESLLQDSMSILE